MRRGAWLAGVLGLVAVLDLRAAPSILPQDRPQQADAIVRLLSDLEAVVESGHLDEFRALASPALPADDLATFERALGGGLPAAATIRERSRRPDGDGYKALVDVLVSRGRTGRLATWEVTIRPKAGGADRVEIAGLTEVAAINGLTKLTLDSSRQFTVHNLALHAPDLTLKMPSGSAFVAESDSGTTVLVLHGDGYLHFAPPDAAEQGQLQIFAGRPEFDTKVDTAFIRLNPAELSSRVSDHSLLDTPAVDKAELERAQKVFDDLSPRTFNVDLSDLSRDRWSLEPPIGSLAVEFKSARFGWLTYVRSAGDAEDISLFDRARNRHISSYVSEEHLMTGGRFYSDDDDAGYDVESYDLDVTFDPSKLWVSGRGSVRVRVKQERIGSVTFRLARSLGVSSVSSPTLGRLLALRVIGQSSLVVSLPKPQPRGAVIVIDIAYSGRLQPETLNREAISVSGTNQDPSSQDELVMPEPRFMYSGRVFWYPRAQVTDYATAKLRLSVPSEYQLVASGTLTGSSVAPIQDPRASSADVRYGRTMEYRVDRPAPYLSCVISRFVSVGTMKVTVPRVAAASSDVARDGLAPALDAGAVNLEVISTPRQANRNRQLPARVADIMRVYANIIGEAPYPNFTLAAADDNLPGGHSPAYFALWQQPLATTPYSWQGDPVSFDSYPYFFLAHEVAHQWWGQGVEWKNYHEQWLSEGLAQYFAAMYAGADRGPDVMRALLAQMRQSAATLSPQGPIYLGYRLGHLQGDSRIFRGIVYNKSAVVLHMLRRLIGDDAFMAGLQRFYRDFRFRLAGTNDLRAAFEAETPMPLRRFFDRWILGSSLPRLRVTSKIEPSGREAVVRIEQVGDVFDLPLTLTVQYVDGRVEDLTIPVTEAVVERRVALRGQVRKIIAKDDLTLATILN